MIQDLKDDINSSFSTTKAFCISQSTLVEIQEEPFDQKIARLLRLGYNNKKNKWLEKVIEELKKSQGIPHSKEISLLECQLRDGHLYFRDRLYVPENELRLLLLKSTHDSR